MVVYNIIHMYHQELEVATLNGNSLIDNYYNKKINNNFESTHIVLLLFIIIYS